MSLHACQRACSGITGGGECPQTSDWEISADQPGKKEARKGGGGNGEEKKENCKIKDGKF